MNKKDYKGYELIKAISDKEIKDKTKIEVHSLQDNIIAVIEYKNKRLEWGTGEFDTSYLFDDYIYFKILEDNIEEIEEIPQYRIDNCTDYNYCYLAEKYNKLAKAVNQIRKDLNK